MKDVLVAALTADDRLDDIGRARMWARLEDQLAPAPRRRLAWLAVVTVAAVAVAIAFVLVPRRDAEPMIAPADATLTAHLGPYTHAALVGPAQLRVVGTPSATTTVRLERGTLLAEFAGGPGRALEIVAPRMRVAVVGTLFAVEVRATSTCVSVAHGRVQVTTRARVAEVATGERLCTDEGMPRAIEPRVQQALEHHALVTADAGTSPQPAQPLEPSSARTESRVEVVAHVAEVGSPGRSEAHADPAAAHIDSSARDSASPARIESHIDARSKAHADPAAHVGDGRVDSASPARSEPARADTMPPPSAIATAPPPSPSISDPPLPNSNPTQSAPPPKPVPPTKPASPPPPTGNQLYRSAEAALARNDVAAADRALATLIANEPTSPLRAQALYDRARIAYGRRAWADARTQLAALAAIIDSPLAESGHYLTCRIAVESRDAAAVRCLRDFRAAFPRSPHDRDVLGTLAQLAHASGGCAAASTYTGELARRYPHSTLAAAWRDKCPESK